MMNVPANVLLHKPTVQIMSTHAKPIRINVSKIVPMTPENAILKSKNASRIKRLAQ